MTGDEGWEARMAERNRAELDAAKDGWRRFFEAGPPERDADDRPRGMPKRRPRPERER